jgi:hypothetical protein
MLSFDQIQIRAERNGAHVIPRKRRNMLCTASQAKSSAAELSEKRVACADRIFLPELRCGRARVGGSTSKLFRFTPLSRARAGFALTCVAVVHQRSKVRKKFSWVQNPVRFNSWFLLGMMGTLQNFYMGLTHAQNFGDLFHKDENKFGRLSMYGSRSRKPM